jgi:tRNA G10  N-methylase Trm11
MIRSISFNQHDILKDIIKLYCSRGIDVDPTYSTGGFYKEGLKQPKHRYDIHPVVRGIEKADCRSLPLKDASVRSIVFDPPFLATTGKSLRKKNSSNKLNRRFGVCSSEKELRDLYHDSMEEFHRVLKKDGILIFKCQDKVSSGKQIWNHCWIYEVAQEWFKVEDLFILLAKNRLVANWQLRNQKHARKFHCYFWVFRKRRHYD